MNRKLKLKEFWNQNKWWVYMLFAMIFVWLILQVVLTIWDVADEEWEKMGSPYDIQKEYQLTDLCSNIRSYLIEKGFSDDNWFSNYLKSKQRQYYETIKAVVPEDDIILDILYMGKEYLEYLEKGTNNEQLNRFILSNFDKFFTKASRIKKVDEVIRYVYISIVGHYYSNNPTLNQNKYYQNFFETRLQDAVKEMHLIPPYKGQLIILKGYIGMLLAKTTSNYTKEESVSCYDSNYVELKDILGKAKAFLSKNEISSSKRDKQYRNMIDYIQHNVELIDTFERQECKKK